MTDKQKPYSICMIAYANYFTDARIKKYVEALLKQGHTVDVYALGQLESCPPGLRLVSLARKTESERALPYVIAQLWFSTLVFFRIGLSFFKRRYQVVHVHNMPDFLVFCALIPKLFGARIILDVHDTMPEAYATKIGLPLTHPMIQLLRTEERLSAAFADWVITTNDLQRDSLIGHGIPPEKISIIMNTGNRAIFYPRPHPKPSQRLTLVYHGTIAARLGLDLILDAIRLALPTCPNLNLLLIGDGEFLPAVRKLIDQYQLADAVQIIGRVPVENLPGYLSMADVGIVGNRRYTEEYKNWMLPVKMLEYAAMEIPTIAPRLKVIENYFDDTNALFYEPDNVEDMACTIRNIYDHPQGLEKVAQGLRDFNVRHNWIQMEKRYLDKINGLVALE